MLRGEQVKAKTVIGFSDEPNHVPAGTPGIVRNVFDRAPFHYEVDFDRPNGRGWLCHAKEIEYA